MATDRIEATLCDYYISLWPDRVKGKIFFIFTLSKGTIKIFCESCDIFWHKPGFSIASDY